jgi:hypothetical protein
MPEMMPVAVSKVSHAGNPVAPQVYAPEQPVALNVMVNGAPSQTTE